MEPKDSTPDDAVAFGALNAKLRTALAPLGARLSTYSNSGDEMIKEIPAFLDGVDAVMTGQTYNPAPGTRGNLTSYNQWLASYLAVAKTFNETASGEPIPHKMVPSMLATDGRGAWNCQSDGMAARVTQLLQDDVRELGLFAVVPAALAPGRLSSNAMASSAALCIESWLPHARRYLSGSAAL